MTESSEICICNEIVKKAISELESSNPRSTGNRTKARRRNPPSSKSNSFDDLLHRRFDPNMQSIYSVPVPTSGVATSSGHRISDSIDTMIVIQDEENCPPQKAQNIT